MLLYSSASLVLSPFRFTSHIDVTVVLLRVLHPTLDLSMDMAGGSSALGTTILLYSTHTGRNQAWNFKLVAEPRKPFDPSFAPAFFVSSPSGWSGG